MNKPIVIYATFAPEDAASPGRLLQDMAASFRPVAAKKGLEFRAAPYSDWHDVVVDESKVRQIVSNLLGNAIKYTSAGWVQLEIKPPDGQNWSFVVEDSGCGMTREEAERIFEEYYRVPATAHLPGTGLGLSICKQLVERLQGKISLRSEPGQGTRFEVRLPVMVYHWDHPGAFACLEPPQHLFAGEVGKTQVKQDQIGMLFLRRDQPQRALRCAEHPYRRTHRQNHLDQRKHVRVVLDAKHRANPVRLLLTHREVLVRNSVGGYDHPAAHGSSSGIAAPSDSEPGRPTRRPSRNLPSTPSGKPLRGVLPLALTTIT